MLYHVSNVMGIKLLEPKVSTHEKGYVYAVENKITGLLFGVRKDDFDFIISNNDNNVPIIYECYPGAFESIYKNKRCSVYELDDVGFKRGMTSWNVELVSEEAVPVIEEIIIDDIYTTLLNEEKNDNIIIHKFEDTIEYKKRISKHIVDRLIRFDALKYIDTDERFIKYYSKIIKALTDVLDGSYL